MEWTGEYDAQETVDVGCRGAFVMLLVPAANAVTPAPLRGIGDSDVIVVAQGCGRGWVRNRYGRCVRVGRPVVICRSVRTAYGWRRVCR